MFVRRLSFTDASIVYFFFFFFSYKFSFSVQVKISVLKNIRRSSITRRGNYPCIFSINIVSFFLQFSLLISIYILCSKLVFVFFFTVFILQLDDNFVMDHDSNADSSHLMVSRMHFGSSGHSIMS